MPSIPAIGMIAAKEQHVVIAGRTRKRDPFGVDADCLVEIDDLPLDPIAFAPVPRAAIPMCAIFGGISRARAITVSIAPLSS
jgi:hypothetical protein